MWNDPIVIFIVVHVIASTWSEYADNWNLLHVVANHVATRYAQLLKQIVVTQVHNWQLFLVDKRNDKDIQPIVRKLPPTQVVGSLDVR